MSFEQIFCQMALTTKVFLDLSSLLPHALKGLHAEVVYKRNITQRYSEKRMTFQQQHDCTAGPEATFSVAKNATH